MKITIESLETGFIFQQDNYGKQSKPSVYELKKMGSDVGFTMQISNVHNQEVLAQGFRLEDIEVDGIIHTTYENLSAALMPILFKKGGRSGDGGTSDTIAKTIKVTLTDLGVATEQEVTPQIIADYFNSLGLVKSEKDFYIIKVIPPEPTFNFDVTGNWGLRGITDVASFQAYLENKGMTGVVITDFSLVAGRLKANVTATGTDLLLYNLEITEVEAIGIIGLQYLSLDNNQITTFNPTIVLPLGLQNLYLSSNQITDWSLSEPWANSLPNGTTTIDTRYNLSSSNGTTFKSILTGKGYTVNS